MTKQDLIKKISADTGVEQSTIGTIVDSAMMSIKAALVNDEPVFLRGFGTFLNKVRRTKVARNIKKNTTLVVPEHRIPFFKPCKEFKSSLL